MGHLTQPRPLESRLSSQALGALTLWLWCRLALVSLSTTPS